MEKEHEDKEERKGFEDDWIWPCSDGKNENL